MTQLAALETSRGRQVAQHAVFQTSPTDRLGRPALFSAFELVQVLVHPAEVAAAAAGRVGLPSMVADSLAEALDQILTAIARSQVTTIK